MENEQWRGVCQSVARVLSRAGPLVLISVLILCRMTTGLNWVIWQMECEEIVKQIVILHFVMYLEIQANLNVIY